MNNRWLAVFVPPVLSSLMAIDVSSFHQILLHMRAPLRARGGEGGDGEGGEGEASPNVEAARVVCLLSRFPRPDDYQVAAELVAKSLGKGGVGEKNEEGKFLPRKAFPRDFLPDVFVRQKDKCTNATGAQPGMCMCCSLKSRET